MASNDIIGFLKYEGTLVDEGILDAKSAARALNGFQSAIQYFLVEERSDLATIEIPIPVKIQKGSWEALIPTSIETWILTMAGVAATTYFTTAAKKMAENDFKEIGVKQFIQRSLRSIQWLIKLGKHLGNLEFKNLTGLKWERTGYVGVPNEKGEILYLPEKCYKQFIACPLALLSEISSVIEVERKLVVGVSDGEETTEVTITHSEKHIFYVNEDEKIILFPELTHGLRIELEGVVTRGNEMANTVGFLYNNHILTCIPSTGSIVRFKKNLFLKCKIIGQITRSDKNQEPNEPRPKILFDDLIILDGDEQMGLDLKGLDEEAS